MDRVVLSLVVIAVIGQRRVGLQPAMALVRPHRGRSARADHFRDRRLFDLWSVSAMADVASFGGAVRSLGRRGLRAPEPAVTGSAARISPLRRLRSGVLLLATLALLGLALAALIGIVILLAGALLEQAIK
jgi:hypothetical protein